MDTTQTIFHSAARFFSGTMLSRITGMMRDMALAYAFGTQSTIAALMVAFRFAHLLRRLFGEGALQTAFIPHFEQLRKDDPQRAGQFFRDLAKSLTFFLAAIILVISLVLGYIYNYIDLSPGNAQIVWLTLLMMPSLLFICLFGINASLLQCEKCYFAPSAAPVAFNLIWIAGVFFVKDFTTSHAMSWLAIFIIIACFAQWAITMPKTFAILRNYQPNDLWGKTRLFSKDVLYLITPLALGILGVAASQINNALDAIFARWASDEGPAILWYAIRVQQLPLALFGIAISGALLPPLARAIKNGDKTKFHLFLDFALRRSLALMIPITVGLFVMGDSCINLIYGRGDFGNASIAETTRALWGYGIGLVPMTLTLVLAPAFYAKGNYRTPSFAAVASMVINVVLNTVMIAALGLGAASVAVATSISAFVNLAWLVVVLSKQEGPILSPNLLQSTCKIALAACIAGISVFGADLLFWGQVSGLDVARGITPLYDTHLTTQLIHFGFNSAIFLTTLIASALVLKAEELTNLISKKQIMGSKL